MLVLCQLFYPELVSTGQTLTELAEQLAAQGVDVEVLCGPPTVLGRRKKIPKHMEHEGIHIARVWGTRFPKLSLVGRVLNQLTFACSVFLHLLIARPKKPILVLTNPPFLAMGCALLRLLRLGPPYLYLVFDVYPETAVRLGLLRQRGWPARIWDRLNLMTYKHASAIIVIGRCMKDVVEQKLRAGGLPASDKLHHIPVWCDDAAIGSTSLVRTSLAEQFGVQNKFVVGYFGNMGRFHDMETLMGAAELLRDEREIVFLFVGEGHKKQWAMQWARERGLENCRFHSYVAREELGHLLALADLGLVSLVEGQEGLSVPSKTFGLMAAGVPTLAVMSGVSEIARMVEEIGCGVWIPPGDRQKLVGQIIALKRDDKAIQTMGANGRRAIRDKYNLKNVCREYVDLITRIAAQTEHAEPDATVVGTVAARRGPVTPPVSITESREPSGKASRQPEPSTHR